MNLHGTRRVMETTSHETANQYLRFGWNLINQYVVDPTADQPRMVKFVLASVSRLEDTRQLAVLEDPDEVNRYLALGWKLIDKHVTSAMPGPRDEKLHFVLAWQSDERPLLPGDAPKTIQQFDTTSEPDDSL